MIRIPFASVRATAQDLQHHEQFANINGDLIEIISTAYKDRQGRTVLGAVKGIDYNDIIVADSEGVYGDCQTLRCLDPVEVRAIREIYTELNWPIPTRIQEDDPSSMNHDWTIAVGEASWIDCNFDGLARFRLSGKLHTAIDCWHLELLHKMNFDRDDTDVEWDYTFPKRVSDLIENMAKAVFLAECALYKTQNLEERTSQFLFHMEGRNERIWTHCRECDAHDFDGFTKRLYKDIDDVCCNGAWRTRRLR